MMVGAIGGRSCVAAGEMYSEYESAGGTGQAHVWFERPDAGWTADPYCSISRRSDQRDHQRRLSEVVGDHDRHRHPRPLAHELPPSEDRVGRQEQHRAGNRPRVAGGGGRGDHQRDHAEIRRDGHAQCRAAGNRPDDDAPADRGPRGRPIRSMPARTTTIATARRRRTPSRRRGARQGTRPAPARTSSRRRAGTRRRRGDSTSATTNQRPNRGIGRVEGDRGADQRHECERLAPHLRRPVMRPAAPPVGDRERRRRRRTTHRSPRSRDSHCPAGRVGSCDRVQRSRDGATVRRRVASRAGRGAPAFAAPARHSRECVGYHQLNWHVTVRFFGDAEPADVLAGLAEDATAHRDRGVRVRPCAGSARAHWSSRSPGLDDLAAAVVAATAGVGVPRGPRSFNGHLTLARLRRGASGDLTGTPIAAEFHGRPRSCWCAVSSPATVPPTRCRSVADALSTSGRARGRTVPTIPISKGQSSRTARRHGSPSGHVNDMEVQRCPSTCSRSATHSTASRELSRREARPARPLQAAAESVGGSLESLYFAFGDTDVFAVADLPDNAAAAALALNVTAAGGANVRTVVLLTQRRSTRRRRRRCSTPPPGAVRPAGGPSVARGDRPVGLGRPVAPRAGVETGVGDPGDRHREQFVAGGDAASAIDDGCRADGGETPGELVSRSVPALGVEVVEVRQVDRARDVAGLRIDRFDLAAVPLGGAGVDRVVPLSTRSVMSSASTTPLPTLRRPGTRSAPGRRRRWSSGRPACFPGLVATVEDGRAGVTDRPQHPPQS